MLSIIMTVNSTEFQQKVGYYLKLVDSGSVLNIIRQKPRHTIYQLKAIQEVQPEKSNKKLLAFFKKLDKTNDEFGFYGNDSIRHTRNLRK